MTTSAQTNTIPELIYLFAVHGTISEEIQSILRCKQPPSHVRVATLAPLSNYGFRPDATATLLHADERGLVYGAPDFDDVPRAFVPWTNVAYLADGTSLGRRYEQAAEAKPGTVTVHR